MSLFYFTARPLAQDANQHPDANSASDIQGSYSHPQTWGQKRCFSFNRQRVSREVASWCLPILLVASLSSPSWGQCFQSASNSPYGVGSSPFSIAVGDFNGDSKPDLATANSTSNNVSVLLGTGSGTFSTAVSYTVGSGPFSIAVGDFNGDGKPDLATANNGSGSNDVSVLLNTGSGSFGSATNYPVGARPYSVAVGDFNGDNKLDLATANSTSNNVSVLLGDGTGGFGSLANYVVGSFPVSVAVGDFNGDSKPDLAVANANSNSISVLLNQSTGPVPKVITGPPSTTFSAPASYTVGTYPRSVAVGDFNGDGKLDLAVANEFSNSLSVLPNTGSGGFGSATTYAVGENPQSIAIGDFNGDGRPDLVTANRDNNNLSVLLGTGSGGFGPAASFGVGSQPHSVATGDFNGDSKPDLAVANLNSNNVSVVLSVPFSPGLLTARDSNGRFVAQATGGVSYERLKAVDIINGYQISQFEQNSTGFFVIDRSGSFSITVTGASGCKAVVNGVAP